MNVVNVTKPTQSNGVPLSGLATSFRRLYAHIVPNMPMGTLM